MIPALVEEHLRLHHLGYVHHRHRPASTAQDLAAAEHVTGHCVAKPVVLRMGEQPAIAVVSAAQRVRLSALEEATGLPVELVPESEFAEWFAPCENGAEPPLSVFGLPILVDARIAGEERLLMPGGTHEDSILLDTGEWMRCESVQTIPDLGAPMH